MSRSMPVGGGSADFASNATRDSLTLVTTEALASVALALCTSAFGKLVKECRACGTVAVETFANAHEALVAVAVGTFMHPASLHCLGNTAVCCQSPMGDFIV